VRVGLSLYRIIAMHRRIVLSLKVDPGKNYKMAGVRWYGEGVFHRETVRGEGMSAAQVTHSEKNATYGNRIIQLGDGWVVNQSTPAAAGGAQ